LTNKTNGAIIYTDNNTKLIERGNGMKNYFAVERNGNTIDKIVLQDKEGNIAFAELMQMSYDEMKQYENIESFIVAIMDATNSFFGENDAETFVTLVREDDVFIWGMIVGPGETDDKLNYVFIDWQQDGKQYRYAPEEME
jgi:hypothetical protein